MAFILRYLTEFGSFPGALRKSGWRCRRKKFTFVSLSPGEFLVYSRCCGAKNLNVDQLLKFGCSTANSHSLSNHRSGQSLACDNETTVYSTTLNFTLIGIYVASSRKTANWTKLWMLGGSCTRPFAPITAKFGVLEYAYRLLFHAKFHLDRFVDVSPFFWGGGKNLKFDRIFKFKILCWRYLEAQIQSWVRVYYKLSVQYIKNVSELKLLF